MPSLTTSRRPAFAAVTSLTGVACAAVVAVGGIVAWRDPLMRPPRLPDRRPPAWGLPVAGAAYGAGVAVAGRIVARGGRTGITATAAAGLSAAAVPGIMLPLFELARRTRARRDSGPAGTVVVLGCALREGRPSTLLRDRLALAERVARRGPEPATIICCGGVGDGAAISEAEVMADWLRRRGLPEVLLESESTSTSENLAHAAPMVGRAPVTVVTSDFHVFRATSLARRQGLVGWRVEGAPTPPRFWATSIFREFLALGAWWPAPGAVLAATLFAWWSIPEGRARWGGASASTSMVPRGGDLRHEVAHVY